MLHVRVHPNARRNEVTRFTDGVLHVKVSATPVEGKANRELFVFLSEALGVSKSSLAIVKGITSRDKVIAINGLTDDDILSRLLP